MVIGIIRIVLSGIILCSEIIRYQIKKQACAAVIAVKATDDLVKKAFHHQFFDHDPCPDAQAAAPGIPSLILRQFGHFTNVIVAIPDPVPDPPAVRHPESKSESLDSDTSFPDRLHISYRSLCVWGCCISCPAYKDSLENQ